MVRKILTGLWLVLCGALFVLSVIGVWTIWKYKKPLTMAITARQREIDAELALAQTALQDAQNELKRALRFVDAAEEALENFSEQTAVAKEFLDTVTEVLDETIKPSLATSKEQLEEAQQSMDDLRATLEALNRLPFINLDVPDLGVLNSFEEIIDSLESEIIRVEELAEVASIFVDDSSYLIGGDFSETRENIQELQTVVTEYEGKIDTWRGQLAVLKSKTPDWIQRTAVTLTVFLLWFALSQFGLILHGLAVRRGENPLAVLQRENPPKSD